MKVSVSLPSDDVRFLDEYAQAQGLESRSAAMHRAVRLLRVSELSAQYEHAWDEWFAEDVSDDWERTAGDGVGS